MGSKYTTQSTSGYNASPPSDDGSQTAANLITWAGIKSKIGDVLKTFGESINSALVSAFDYSVRQITTSDSTVASDHMRCVEIAPTVTTAVTVSLGDAATMTNVYRVFVKNSSAINQTLGRVTSGDTIDGVAGNLTLPPRSGVILQTNNAASGYVTTGAVGGFSTFGSAIPRSYLAGLGMSTAGSSATMSIAAGQATDSTNAVVMTLAAAISKTTSSWAVGSTNGGLDSGSIANSTWYHFYEIMRPDTGVVDVLFSTSASSPTLPANYTYFRRIGSGKTNGSAQWVSFTQDGDYFRWAASVLDVNTTNPGNSAVTATLASVPTGVNVQSILNSSRSDSAGAGYVYISDLAATDEAPSLSAAPLASYSNNVAGSQNAGNVVVRTNTSAQVRYRLSGADGNTVIRIASLGWFDRRGKDS